VKKDWQRKLRDSIGADKTKEELSRIFVAHPNVELKYDDFDDALTGIRGSFDDVDSVRNALKRLMKSSSNDVKNVSVPAGVAGRPEVDRATVQPPPRSSRAAARTGSSSGETYAKQVDNDVEPRDTAAQGVQISSVTVDTEEHIWFYIETRLADKLQKFQVERTQHYVKLCSPSKEELSGMVEVIIRLREDARRQDFVSWPIVLNSDTQRIIIERQLTQEGAILYRTAPDSSASDKPKRPEFSHLVIGPRSIMCRVLQMSIDQIAQKPPSVSKTRAAGVSTFLSYLPWGSVYGECYKFSTSTGINVHIGQGIYF
jgi:hypothetical protein